MTSRLHLPSRATKARAASLFIGQVSNGQHVTYKVPGSQGKSYRVKIRRNIIPALAVLSAQCWQDETSTPCRGCGAGTVCYHAMATCQYLARRRGLKIAWCASYEAAIRLSAMGGETFRLVAHQAQGELWGVTTLDRRVVEVGR